MLYIPPQVRRSAIGALLFLTCAVACDKHDEEAFASPTLEELRLITQTHNSNQTADGAVVNGCYWINLSKKIPWATSGIWLGSGLDLLVVNTGTRSQEQESQLATSPLLWISSQGEVTEISRQLRSVTSESSRRLEAPTQIRKQEDSYLLQENQEPIEILRLAADSSYLESIGVGHRVLAPNALLTTVYDWSPIGSGVLAFGDLAGPAEDTYSGFIYFGGNDNSDAILKTVATESDVRNQYTRNIRYIASIGKAGFVLLLGEEPKVLRVDTLTGSLHSLEFFPEDFSRQPRLTRQPGLNGPRQAKIFYEIMERTRMVAGLYAWKEHLFLLAKEPMTESGLTTWWLIELHPQDGRELNRIRLPTTAAHLTLVPGQQWALLEKGFVESTVEIGAPYMNTATLVIVASTWLEAQTAGRLQGDQEATCPQLLP